MAKLTAKQVTDYLAALAVKAGLSAEDLASKPLITLFSESPKFAELVGVEGIMTRSDYSREINEAQQIKQQHLADYNKLQVWFQDAQQTTAANVAVVERYRATYGDLDDDTASDPPSRKTATPAVDIDKITKDVSNKVIGETATYLRDVQKVQNKHFLYFKQPIDLEPLLEICRRDNISLPDAYEKEHGAEITEIDAKAAQADIDRKVQEGIQKIRGKESHSPAAPNARGESAFLENLNKPPAKGADGKLVTPDDAALYDELEDDFVDSFNLAGKEHDAKIHGSPAAAGAATT